MFRSRWIRAGLIWLAVGHYHPASAENLLVNPGFEAGGFCGTPCRPPASQAAGWAYRISGDCYIRSESGEPYPYGPGGGPVVHAGKEAIRIGALRGGRVELYQEIPVTPDTVYWAAVWVRPYDGDGQGFGRSGEDSAGFRLQQLDAGGRVLVEHPKVETRQACDAYEQLAATFRTRSAAAKVRFVLDTVVACNHWHGWVSYDDCNLEAAASGLHIASKGGPAVAIVVPSPEPLLQHTGQWCRQYLTSRGFLAAETVVPEPPPDRRPLWALETMDRCPVAKSHRIDTAFLDLARADAYILAARLDGDRPVVCIVGRDAIGVRSGLARLIALSTDVGTALTVPQTTEYREPFFALRRMNIATTGRLAQGKDWTRKYSDVLWTNWSDDRIRQYAEQLWLLGLNSIETEECRGYRGVFSDEDLASSVTPKLRTLMTAAHENGLQVGQFIWGQSLFKEGDNLCWNDPTRKEREIMEKEFRRLARTYGDLVDHIVVHVGDPGGCNRNGCDPYKTTQQIATFLHNEYRKINPKVTATLSAWANEGFWKGRAGVKFLDETYSAKDLGIALHRWYDRDRARMVRQSGRACDIWGWYLSDYEMELNMSLTLRTIDQYYSALPEQAARDIRAISDDLCFHGWPQIINIYVTAQKMWSPRRSLGEMKWEFCAATYGEANAVAVMALYEACEAYIHPDHYWAYAPETDCPPDVFGTAPYNRQLREALELGRTVRLDSGQLPRLTTATEPKAFYDYLIRNLQLIQRFSEAAERIAIARSEHAQPANLQSIFDEALAKAEAYKEDLDYRGLVARLRGLLPKK